MHTVVNKYIKPLNQNDIRNLNDIISLMRELIKIPFEKSVDGHFRLISNILPFNILHRGRIIKIRIRCAQHDIHKYKNSGIYTRIYKLDELNVGNNPCKCYKDGILKFTDINSFLEAVNKVISCMPQAGPTGI